MTMNLYPLKTDVDGRALRNLRLRADDSGTVVWRMDRESGHVEEFLRLDSQPVRVGATANWRVGEQIFSPQRGCGCNHPMYTWVPTEG